MSYKKIILILSFVVEVLLIGGILAYLTDADAKVNVMTFGDNVEISLSEVWRPEDGDGIIPGTTVEKAPSIKNDSTTTPAYVFAEVVVPCYAGTGTTVDTPLFTFTANSDWTLINTPSVDTESKTITYVYAYGTSSEMTTLNAETTTLTPVFNQVTLAQTLTDEQRQTANETTNIEVNAYGVQVDNLETTNPAEIYGIVNSEFDLGNQGGEEQTGIPTEMKNAANNETIYKTESAAGTVIPLSTTETTKLKDNKNNEIKVPMNFGIAYDSGENVAEGIVIEDVNHNQYVWIPVGTITDGNGNSKTIDLIRSNFNGTTTPDAETVIDRSFYEYNATTGASYGNTKAKNIGEFVSSANNNHGYYVARYEAGIDASRNQYHYAGCSGSDSTMTYGNSSKMIAKDGSVKPLSKSGMGVWDAVTQPEAATICQAMYTKTANGVESDLINSFAWDTAIDYIQKCGTASNSARYATTQGKSGVDVAYPQTTGTNILLATNSLDQQCKIFDMAGNCTEWSTETTSYGSGNYPCVLRGGYYGYIDGVTNRGVGSTTYRYSTGFRPILYL